MLVEPTFKANWCTVQAHSATNPADPDRKQKHQLLATQFSEFKKHLVPIPEGSRRNATITALTLAQALSSG